MQSQDSSKKDNIYWRVLGKAIQLDISCGHLKWSISSLAKKSKITRSLIYYYFGHSKISILLEAVNLFGVEFSGETPIRRELWKHKKFGETIIQSRNLINQIPDVVPFYFLNRLQKTAIGNALRAKEQSFKKKVTRFFPHKNATDQEAICAILFGLTMAPEAKDQTIERAIQLALS